ncbi:unnamed protein product [Soboliphyme baturini]|uniref:Secreted protein n=1 Tax=Soboliphyme baturini TaxID=241478 RepID=A0A183J778_9BILA|nr:unnamed protein product [Soboliphyme baturini]
MFRWLTQLRVHLASGTNGCHNGGAFIVSGTLAIISMNDEDGVRENRPPCEALVACQARFMRPQREANVDGKRKRCNKTKRPDNRS